MQRRVGWSALVVVGALCAPGQAEIKPAVVSGDAGQSGTPVHLGVPLEVGEVFVVTSWTALYSSTSSAKQVDLESSAGRVDSMAASGQWSSQHQFDPGVVFPRDGAGLSDSYVSTVDSTPVPVALQGYTASEGELLGACAQTAAADAVSPVGLAILAVLLGATGLVVMRRQGAAA